MENTGDPNRMWVEELIDHPPDRNSKWRLGFVPLTQNGVGLPTPFCVY
jgi:hypothetical protein